MKVYIFSVTIALYLHTSGAIDCYQCSGSDPKKPFQCNEWLSSDIDIKPEPCDDVYDAKYCIKHIGRFEGGIGAKRFCSSLDLGNYCNYVKQPGDILQYRTCVFTCTGDGCNPSTTITPNCVLLVTCILTFVYKIIVIR
ncbi:U-scoloptoxin(05)-Er1a isoform X2 [Tribolium castaneum]|uniref:Protein sleepless n=1 Tax=Tribolium castaneum TaxID=7070 RepID=D7EIA8_TRICA|nr:hypothetical protein TcasGA2_TC035013 [Tribolium castaneum]